MTGVLKMLQHTASTVCVPTCAGPDYCYVLVVALQMLQALSAAPECASAPQFPSPVSHFRSEADSSETAECIAHEAKGQQYLGDQCARTSDL